MASTYRPRGYGISPALKRAREPYRLKNAITGTLLLGFAVSVWAYSMSAVKQDTFDDIDAEVLLSRTSPLSAVASSSSGSLPSQTHGATPSASALTSQSSVASLQSLSSSKLSSPPRPQTLLSQLRPTILEAFTPLRNPSDGSLLVWGAPPLDRLGSVGDRIQQPWNLRSPK